MLFTVQDKCASFIGSSIVNDKFEQLNNKREAAFMLPFKKKAVENQVKIYAGENNVPYNGFSFYKIIYRTEFPKSLIRAYHQMNELNGEAPRKWFKKAREKNDSVL
jgi:hypothetical protein